MDSDLARMVEYVRRHYIDHTRGMQEAPAKALADFYNVLSEGSRPAHLRELIERSSEAKLYWDAVSLMAQEALRSGLPLPRDLSVWTADVLAGDRPRPSKGAQTTRARDVLMYLAVNDLRNGFGLSATRNPTSPPWSGCDVVAEAWGFDYKTVERAWAKRDPILPDPVPTQSEKP